MPKPTTYLDLWAHGFVRVDQRGRKTYLIREQRNGKRYKISTRAHSEAVAKAEYEQWVKDPEGYKPGKIDLATGEEPLRFTKELADEFLEWSKEKGNTGHYVTNQRSALTFWTRHLEGRNIRGLKLATDILPPLAGKKVRQQARKRAQLKNFCAWLREERHLLKMAEDPTLDLTVPSYDPTKRKKRNKAVPFADLIAVRDCLAKWSNKNWADLLTVGMASGWHVTEMVRFARDGRFEKYHGPLTGVAAVLVCPQHKSGGEHRTAVDAETEAAALRVRAYGSFLGKRYTEAIHEACTELGIEPFSGGQLRHSVATHLVDKGADLAVVSSFLGHRSKDTTRRFYATHATPTNPALALRSLPAPAVPRQPPGS